MCQQQRDPWLCRSLRQPGFSALISDTRSRFSPVQFFPVSSVCPLTSRVNPSSCLATRPLLLQLLLVGLSRLLARGCFTQLPRASPHSLTYLCLLFSHHIYTAPHLICWVGSRLFSAPLSRLNFSLLRTQRYSACGMQMHDPICASGCSATSAEYIHSILFGVLRP